MVERGYDYKIVGIKPNMGAHEKYVGEVFTYAGAHGKWVRPDFTGLIGAEGIEKCYEVVVIGRI